MLGHRNLIAFNRALTRWGSRGQLEEGEGTVLCAGGTWIPVVADGAFRSNDSTEAAELVSRGRRVLRPAGPGLQRQGPRQRGGRRIPARLPPYAGLEAFGEPVPQMICYQPLHDPTPMDGITVRPVEDEAGLHAFISVKAAAYTTYGMPPEVLSDLFDATDTVLGDRSAHMIVVDAPPSRWQRR